jgi:hypothetical protein
MFTLVKSAFAALFALMALFSPSAAWSFQQSSAYEDEALSYIDAGNEAEEAGDYASACEYYGRAWGKFDWVHDALLEESRERVGDEDALAENLKIVNRNSRQAYDLKVAACEAAKNMPPSNTVDFKQPVWPDLSSDVNALQATINSAFAFTTESARLRKMGSFAPACERARAAAITYGKAKDEASALLKKSGSYHEVGVRDMDALGTIAAQSNLDAEEYYCKVAVAGSNFKTELGVFAAMKAALHLERGNVSPMTSERAVAMHDRCNTDALYAETKARSVFAKSLGDGCYSFVQMYNMQLPDHACNTLKQAKSNLDDVEQRFAAQGKALATDFTALQAAFKCAVDRPSSASASTGRSDSQGLELGSEESELPPMKLDIKPLPERGD